MKTKQIQTKQAVTGQLKTTLKTMNKEVEPVIERLMQEVEKAHFTQAGPLEFIYTGATEDMENEFDLEIAVPVTPSNGNLPTEFKLKEIPELKCVSTTFKGSMDEIGDTYETIYNELQKEGVQPTNIIREVYENWVSYSSKENVVEIQVGIN